MLKNWFKPKWQSQDPEKRCIAVAQLKNQTPETEKIIESLAANDPDARVRLTALNKVNSLDAFLRLLPSLTQICQQTQYALNIEGLLIHIAQLMAGDETQLDQKLKLLHSIRHAELANHLLQQNTALELQLSAIGYLDDADTLQRICLDHQRAKVRIKAVEKISEPTRLQQILEKTRTKDKSVYKHAKQQLQKQQAMIDEAAELNAQRKKLCEQFEQLAQSKGDPLLPQRWTALKNTWQPLAASSEPQYTQRIKVANASIAAQVEGLDTSDQALHSETPTNIEEAQQERLAAIHTLKESLALVQQTSVQDASLPSLKAVLTTQKIRFNAADEAHAASESDRQAFEQAHQRLKQFIDAFNRFQSLQQSISELNGKIQALDETELDQLPKLKQKAQTLSQQLNWPKPFEAPTQVHQLAHNLASIHEKEASQQKIIGQLEHTLTDLKQQLLESLDQGSLKDAIKTDQKIKKLLKKFPQSDQIKHQTQIKPLTLRLQEMRDWQGYAAAQKKQALCDEMAQLVDAKLLPAEKAQTIKRLQNQWKALGSLEKNEEQALWKIFSEHADKAFEPCRAHFKAVAEQKQNNLEKRREICEQLDHYLTHNDWSNTNWKAVVEILKLSKTQWRQYAPVEREAVRALQARFNALLASIQEKLDTHQNTNLRRKQKLVEAAQALASNEDVQAAVQQIKEIRNIYNTIGTVPRANYKKIHTEFNQACELIFERRKKLWTNTQAQKVHNEKQIKQAIDSVHTLLEEDANMLLQSHHVLDELEQTFIEHQPLEKSSYQRLRKHIDQLSQAYGAAKRKAEAIQADQEMRNLRKKSQLCRDLETWVLEGVLDQDKLTTLKHTWRELGEIPSVATSALNLRFDVAINAFAQKDTSQLANQEQKRFGQLHEITIQMEILAGIDSPASDHELRMQLQINRLNKSVSEKKIEDKQHHVKRLEIDWCTTGPLRQSKLAPLTERFLNAKNICLNQDAKTEHKKDDTKH